jgi:hypothetical protein
MFPIIMGLEERDAQVHFEHDAAHAPDVTGLTPSQLKNNFRSPVVSSRDNARVVLMIKCGRAKVNETDLGTLDPSDSPLPTIVIVDLIVRIEKENVLGF